jgi:HK97 family phage major capsid protein
LTVAKKVLMGDGSIRVTREEVTYHQGRTWSFFGDLAAQRTDEHARDRIARHARECRLEQRTNPNTTASTGGEFAIPIWLESAWTSQARAASVFADLIPQMPLPPGSSVNIPKATTGFATGIQPANADADTSADLVTLNNSAPVVTISGHGDISQQLYDLSPVSDVFYARDLAEDWASQLEQQLFNGTGTNGQILGLANLTLPTANVVDGSGATTVTLAWPLLGRCRAAVWNGRHRGPSACFMAGRRWSFLASSLDSSNRPIASPHSEAHQSDLPLAGAAHPVGRVLGTQVRETGSIPTGSSPDNVYFCRPEDMLLLLSEPHISVVPNPLSGTLQNRVVFRRYCAAVINRFSAGTAILQNLPAPTNF